MYYLNKAHFLSDHSILFFGIVHIWTRCGAWKVVSKKIGGSVIDVHGSNYGKDNFIIKIVKEHISNSYLTYSNAIESRVAPKQNEVTKRIAADTL